MSNTITENPLSNNQNTTSTEDSKQQVNSNEGYTERQLQSAFQPSSVTFLLKFVFFSIFALTFID